MTVPLPKWIASDPLPADRVWPAQGHSPEGPRARHRQTYPFPLDGRSEPSAGDDVVDDLLLDGPASRLGAAGDADLGVDVLNVVFGRPRRDEQLRRDLAGGSAVGHEA